MSKHDLNPRFHQEHKEWSSQLDFYTEEIRIFQNELSLIVDRHPDQFSITEHADEYHEIFEKKLNEISNLRQQLQHHEHEISKDADPRADDIWDHETTRTRILEFTATFEKLKKNFRRFVSRQL